MLGQAINRRSALRTMFAGLTLPLPCRAQGSEAVAAAAAACEALLKKHEVPGAVAAFADRGRVSWIVAKGYADKAAARLMEPYTLFEAASLSKPVFACTVLRLANPNPLIRHSAGSAEGESGEASFPSRAVGHDAKGNAGQTINERVGRMSPEKRSELRSQYPLMNFPNAAASLVTTAGDYAQFLLAVTRPGAFLSEETRKSVLVPRVPAGMGVS